MDQLLLKTNKLTHQCNHEWTAQRGWVYHIHPGAINDLVPANKIIAITLLHIITATLQWYDRLLRRLPFLCATPSGSNSLNKHIIVSLKYHNINQGTSFERKEINLLAIILYLVLRIRHNDRYPRSFSGDLNNIYHNSWIDIEINNNLYYSFENIFWWVSSSSLEPQLPKSSLQPWHAKFVGT